MQAIQTNTVQVCNRRWVKSLVALFLITGLIGVDGPGYAVQAASNSTILGTTGLAPVYISVDAAGNIYTRDANGYSKITPAGVSTIFAKPPDNYGGDFVMDAAGNIYSVDYRSNNVFKITPDGVSTIFATIGASPSAIAIDAAGNIYTTSQRLGLQSWNRVVSKITPDGVSTDVGFAGLEPVDIAIDAAGNIYVLDQGYRYVFELHIRSGAPVDGNVLKITPDGVSTILGTTGRHPVKIVVDAAGNIYVTNYHSHNVSKISPDGVSTILGKTGLGPVGIVTDAAGNIYTANDYSNNVSKITPDGVSTIFAKTGRNPNGIVMDAAGNIYTANSGSNNVSKITPTLSTKKSGAKKTAITCKKGKVVKKVTALKPVCPKGYKKA